MQIHSSSLAFAPLPQQRRSAEGAETGKEANTSAEKPNEDNRGRHPGGAETYNSLAGLNRQEPFPVRQPRDVASAEHQPSQLQVRQALSNYRETLGYALQDSARALNGIDFYV